MKRRDLFVGAAALAAAGLRTAQAQTPRTRKNLLTLSADDPFFTDYGEAIRRMHQLSANDRRNWRQQALIHADRCHTASASFLPWHRHYILAFEEICGALINKPSFALPYWDWTKNNGRLPAAFFDNGPLNVAFWNDPSNYNSPNWGSIQTVGTRAITATQGLTGNAFQVQTINTILSYSDYSIFAGSLEGTPHNIGHGRSGGTTGHMGNGLSSLDPIFWLHHCNVDRLWAEWQTAGNQTPQINQSYAGHFADVNGSSKQSVTAANAMDFRALGYTYDVFAPPSSGNAVAVLEATPGGAGLLPMAAVAQPKSIGLSSAAVRAQPNIAGVVKVKAADLVANLSATRVFRPTEFAAVKPRVGMEAARIIARVSVKKDPGPISGLLVNAYVNCPYLSPETPDTDPHFAGSFALFGSDDTGKKNIYLDLTNPLREQAADGRLATEDINVQFMPLAIGDAKPEKTFTVESVEFLRL